MKAIRCEMCCSTNLVKEDGLYVCQCCGAKYSVEEAKKLMVEIDGTVEVQGTVKVDNTDKVSNYLALAEDAFIACDNKQVELYCNKVLEIDENNCKAYALKAKATAWQSTLARNRLEEAKFLFAKAIELTPEDEVAAMKATIAQDITNVANALLNKAIETFADNPSKDMTKTCLVTIYTTLAERGVVLALCGKPAFDKDNIRSIWKRMGDAAVAAYKVAYQEYKCDGDNWPNRAEWKNYTEQIDSCIDVTKRVIKEMSGYTSNLITLYKNLIFFTDKKIDSASFTYSAYAGCYVTDMCYTKEAKRGMRKQIASYHQEIEKLDPSYKAPKYVERRTGLAVASLSIAICMFLVTCVVCIVDIFWVLEIAGGIIANILYIVAIVFNTILVRNETEEKRVRNGWISLVLYLVTGVVFLMVNGNSSFPVIYIIGGIIALGNAAFILAYQKCPIKD